MSLRSTLLQTHSLPLLHWQVHQVSLPGSMPAAFSAARTRSLTHTTRILPLPMLIAHMVCDCRGL